MIHISWAFLHTKPSGVMLTLGYLMDCWMGYWKERSPGRPYSGKFMVSTRESLKVAKAMRPLSGENHKAELELRISSVGTQNTSLAKV